MSVHTPQTLENRSIADSQTETLTLANSVVELEAGPAGVVARVDHGRDRVEYAGPLPDATVTALREVSR